MTSGPEDTGRSDAAPDRAAGADRPAAPDGPRGPAGAQRRVERATGLLMARFGLAAPEASDQLAAVADALGQRAEELAESLLEGADRAAPAAVQHPVTEPGAQDDLDEIAGALLRNGLGPLGACGMLLWRREAADCLELVGGAGHSRLERAHWQRISPLWDGPLRRAFATGDELWLPDGPEDPERLPGPARRSARAVLPLRAGLGRPLGVAVVCWPGPTTLDEELRQQVAALVAVAVQVLAVRERRAPYRVTGRLARPVLTSLLDLLAHPALLLRLPGDGGGPLVEHANRAARQVCTAPAGPGPRPLAEALPYASRQLADLFVLALENQVPQVESRVPAVHHPGEPGALVNVRILPVDPEHATLLWHSGSLDHSFSVLRVAGGLGAFEDDLTTGTSRWSTAAFGYFGLPGDAAPVPLAELGALVDPADAADLAEATRRLLGRRQSLKLVVRPRRPAGVERRVQIVAEPLLTHGTLTGITGIYQDVTAQYRTEAALAATFDRLTDVQEESDTRHRLALLMQRALVPETPQPQPLPGLEVAARYRPAAQVYRVGGDWYDVLPLPGGRVMVAVGDLAGHGIEATTGMVALRNGLRGLALTGESPARLLHWLNELTVRLAGPPTATALCAVLEPGARRLTWSSAGHLPPLLLRDGRAELLDSAHNILLGATAGVTYRETTTMLRPEDTLLLYTDGLVERRRTELRDSLAQLSRTAEELASAEPDELADLILARATGDTADDSSLIVLRFR
ncbi:SpoIIE family protein phosphatase [Kitasatospora sp. NPDC094015]|uniref:SpoIIE family protein phosphatase n=1 Tax=Kitasatospora sp. NPDC094015 TaxID=3155205 RepID=UPI00331AF7E6